MEERDVETLTLTLACFSFSCSFVVVEKDEVEVDLLVVVDALVVNLFSSRIGGSDVGRNLTDELEGGRDVVVEVDFCVVVVVVRLALVVTRN